MPDRGLRLERGRLVHFREQDQHVIGRLESRGAGKGCPGGARKLPRVEGDRRFGIRGIQMKMVEAGRPERIRLSLDPKRDGNGKYQNQSGFHFEEDTREN